MILYLWESHQNRSGLTTIPLSRITLSKQSVSKLVSDFFEIIRNEKLNQSSSVTPTVKSLKGILKNAELSGEDYKKYL